MFYIFLILFFCSIGSLAMYLDRNNEERFKEGHFAFWYLVGMISNIVGGIFFFLALIANLSSYSSQKDRFEEIRMELNNQKILEKRFTDLKSEFTRNLGEKYPELEKTIFEKMSPKDADQMKLYFVRYPELKSAATLNYLVEQIKSIADDLYNRQMILESLYRETRYKKVSPWLIIRPEIPADIYPAVYQVRK